MAVVRRGAAVARWRRSASTASPSTSSLASRGATGWTWPSPMPTRRISKRGAPRSRPPRMAAACSSPPTTAQPSILEVGSGAMFQVSGSIARKARARAAWPMRALRDQRDEGAPAHHRIARAPTDAQASRTNFSCSSRDSHNFTGVHRACCRAASAESLHRFDGLATPRRSVRGRRALTPSTGLGHRAGARARGGRARRHGGHDADRPPAEASRQAVRPRSAAHVTATCPRVAGSPRPGSGSHVRATTRRRPRGRVRLHRLQRARRHHRWTFSTAPSSTTSST